jgi:hypothetical protein
MCFSLIPTSSMRKEVAMKSSLGYLVTLALALPSATAQADDEAPVRSVQATGVIADVQELFPRAAGNGRATARPRLATASGAVGSRVLVTPTEVYAFLETPENQKLLKGVKSGTPVKVEGRLLVSGSLLVLDSLARSASGTSIDLTRYAETKGTEVTLQGMNKCQCGLDVKGLPHSCTLGHLHHLEAEDGKIYNYLPYGDGQAAYAGQGTHFKKVALKARLFPGNLLRVESGQLVP